MLRVFAAGILLAVGGGLLVWLGDALSLGLRSVLLAAAIGGAIGWVNRGSAIARIGGALVGFVIAWAGYLLRAAVLPDSTLGRVIGLAAILLLITIICGLTRDRLPLWTVLLGAALFVGGYDYPFQAAPYNVITDTIAIAPALLLPFALAFLLTSLVAAVETQPKHTQAKPENTPESSEVA